MKALGVLGGVLYMLVVMPMWFYLVYVLLDAAEASAFVWGVYWSYMPLSMVAAALIQAGKSEP